MKELPKWERMHHNAGYLKEEKVARKSIEELVKAWGLRYRMAGEDGLVSTPTR